MSEQQNVYVCPRCGRQGRIQTIMPLLDDVRYDAVQCECGVLWRVYYKFTNPKTEIMFVPQDEETSIKEAVTETQGE